MGDITTRGPIFDGAADADIAQWCHQLDREIADEALNQLEEAFKETFRHSSGYYESHVHVQDDPDGAVVTDGGVVYGPWLEGTGSRDFPKTRFKGYSNFRRVCAAMNAKAVEMAEKAMPGLLGRIG